MVLASARAEVIEAQVIGHDFGDEARRAFMYGRAATIYGGSNQIQRNVLGEQVLGLPREPRP